ncbi:restriction endonuclease subunit S [Crocosphaera sp. UHCC 0190]|uniref:restriction endonuclease subunit S n=1 Tax=Crocosphaera sp. UHCC 0190 TaxID=3110246 RepID=UPI002B20E098|nr:restriction endonuclease subunit S [Crocosphaera sp. UHCC 0190]MEA5511491.1 restriction endonuclease subunit S [Crocosphaera sp. UHCC 0190]
MEEQRVKNGYKLTDIGVIPDDWDVQFLGDKTSKIGSGITPTGGAKIYQKSGRPFVRSQNVGWGYLSLEDIAYINDEIHATFSGTEIEENDVLLNITGASIGRSAVADKRVKNGNVNQHVCIIRTIKEELDHHFLNLFLLSRKGQKQIDSFQAGGNRQGLNFGQIKSFKIPIPPLSEQHKIAEVLSDVDKGIAALERLLTKKRNIKQGTMQLLLTGKKRLPGFTGEWEVKKLGDVVDFLDGKRRPIKDSDRAKMRGNFPYYGASGIIDYVNNYIFDDHLILLGEDGENILSRNCRLVYQVSGKIWVNNHAHVLKPKSYIDITFLTEYLESLNYEQYNTGTAQPKLNKKACSIIIVLLPTIKEQKAIANILSDIDKEIEKIEKQRDKYKQIKQGMMQELLTGKTRLIK